MLACIIKQPRSKLVSFINIKFCLYLSLCSSLKLRRAGMKEVDPELFFSLFCFNVTNEENKGEIWWMGIIINEYIFVWIKKKLQGHPEALPQTCTQGPVHQLHTPRRILNPATTINIVVAATSNSQNDTVIIFLTNSEQEYYSSASIHQSSYAYKFRWRMNQSREN